MFREKTAIVLGAGASWHYGYPTGEELVELTRQMADRIYRYCTYVSEHLSGSVDLIPRFLIDNINPEEFNEKSKIKNAVEHYKIAAFQLVKRLESVQPLVIDHFLSWNNSLKDIGRLAITGALCICEMECDLFGGLNFNRKKIDAIDQDMAGNRHPRELDLSRFKDHWIRFLVHKIVYGCRNSEDLFKNNLKSITFNYDSSPENRLFRALRDLEFIEDTDVARFIEESIIHVYGKMPHFKDIFDNEMDYKSLGNIGHPEMIGDHSIAHVWKREMDLLWNMSKKLRTIEAGDKSYDANHISRSRNAIECAAHIYTKPRGG